MSFGFYSEAFVTHLLKLEIPECTETNKRQNNKFEREISPFNGIILIECLMDFFQNEMKKVEQIVKAFKNSSPQFSEKKFSQMYSYKKERTKSFIQINNDKNFKNGLFVSLKIFLHGSHILHKFHKKRIKLKTR
jgi:hypothetical protein